MNLALGVSLKRKANKAKNLIAKRTEIVGHLGASQQFVLVVVALEHDLDEFVDCIFDQRSCPFSVDCHWIVM
jgi:hypothetical protein